jgi:hypothetical protein
MEHLRTELARQFGESRKPPSEGNLISWDGFDELEKESARAFYLNKSWLDVLEHLRSPAAYHHLEEWSVLSKAALPYYLRAHLEYLLETLASDRPDDEYIFFLLGQLYQVIYMHKGSPFSAVQTRLLEEVARVLIQQAAEEVRFENYCESIEKQALEFLAELRAHDS